MPPTVLSVRERREFQINATTGEGSTEYLVQFIAGDEFAFSYEEKAFAARQAVDPITALFIPQEGAILNVTRWPSISVEDIEVEQHERQNNLFLVTVTYTGLDLSSGGALKGIDPWDEPWTFAWVDLTRQVVLRKDHSSPRRDILNSANQPFKDLILVDRSIRRLVLTRKDRLTDFDPDGSIDFFNTVNDAGVDIENEFFVTDNVKVDKWNGVNDQKEVVTGGVSTVKEYFNVTIQLTIDKEGWEGFVLDTGSKHRLNKFNPALDDTIPGGGDKDMDFVRDRKGIEDPGPHLLNGFGQRLINKDGTRRTPINADITVIDVPRSSDKGVYLRYNFFPEKTLNPDMRLDQQP